MAGRLRPRHRPAYSKTETYPSGMAVNYTYDAAGQTLGIAINGTANYIGSVTHQPFGPARNGNGYQAGRITPALSISTDG